MEDWSKRFSVIYYRVAFKVAHTQSWQWRSSSLTSLPTLFTLLRAYHGIPCDRIRIFFSSSEKGMEEMLVKENEGQITSSLTADQFLTGYRVNTPEVTRLELELSTVSDHDVPYEFTLPTNLSQLLAWTKLMVKVRSGELVP
jgi:hypothetical protein